MTASNSPNGFRKYFSLEEAGAILPQVNEFLRKAHGEIAELQDAAILQKRILMSRQESGMGVTDAEVAVLHEKAEAFEQAVIRWVAHFADQGIILRDLESGLIDFPYHSRKTKQDYFLCWRLNEDGIFYFHGIHEGFAGRHPISLLPE